MSCSKSFYTMNLIMINLKKPVISRFQQTNWAQIHVDISNHDSNKHFQGPIGFAVYGRLFFLMS